MTDTPSLEDIDPYEPKQIYALANEIARQRQLMGGKKPVCVLAPRDVIERWLGEAETLYQVTSDAALPRGPAPKAPKVLGVTLTPWEGPVAIAFAAEGPKAWRRRGS